LLGKYRGKEENLSSHSPSFCHRSETTSNTTGFAIIELLRQPDKLEILRAEIDAVPLENGSVLHTHDQLKHLPYLNAVLNETMRLNPIASNGLQRITDSDITLSGRVFIPKNVRSDKSIGITKKLTFSF
jgi:cytochrome P450